MANDTWDKFREAHKGEAIMREVSTDKRDKGHFVGGRKLSEQEADARYVQQKGQKAMNEVYAARSQARRAGFDTLEDYNADRRMDPMDKVGGPKKILPVPKKVLPHNPTNPSSGMPQMDWMPQPGRPTPQPTQPQQSNFNYTPTAYTPPQHNQLSYNDALKQSQGQLDPIYRRALQDIAAERFSNQQVAGEQASARGLGHSGLAADAQNKLAIAAQNQAGNAGLQRASQSAQMAQALVENDYQRAMGLRNQALQEYLGTNQVGLNAAQFNYGQQRDTQGDAFRDKQFGFQQQMGLSDIDFRNRQFDWQQGTDQRDFDLGKSDGNRNYILQQLLAMAQSGIDPTSAQIESLLKWR